MRYFLFALLMTITSVLWAQLDTTSRDYVQWALEAVENEDYKEAISLLDNIYPGDTLYPAVAMEKARYYWIEDELDSAHAIIERIYPLDYTYRHHADLYRYHASIQFEAGHFEEGKAIIEEGLERFPANAYLHSLLAEKLADTARYEEAIEHYGEALFYNPLHEPSYLGVYIMARQTENKAAGVLAAAMYLLISQNSEKGIPLLIDLDEFLNTPVSGKAKPFPNSSISSALKKANDLIEKEVAMSDKYDAESDIEFPFAKNLHLVLSLLEDERLENGFFEQYALPLLTKAKENNHYEGMVYYLYSIVGDGAIADLLNKRSNSSKRDEFKDWFFSNFLEILGQREFKGEDRQAFIYDDGQVNYFAKRDANGQNQGVAYVYHSDGSPQMELRFEDGVINGKKEEYYRSGQQYATFQLEDGKVNGPAELYFRNGNKAQEMNYKDDKLDGRFTRFFKAGGKNYSLEYKNDERNGQAVLYFRNGEVRREFNYKDNELHGSYIEYYPNGEIAEKLTYEEGKRNGPAEFYHQNGQLYIDVDFKDDKYHGDYVKYYPNGKIDEEGTYEDGEVVGEFKSYYLDGTPYLVAQYDENGKYNGKVLMYHVDGVLHTESEYKRGERTSMISYDIQGNITAEHDFKSKGNYVFYNPYGLKLSEGETKRGKEVGNWKFYDLYGRLIREENYNDEGELDGMLVHYHPATGDVSEKVEYKEGESNGPISGYYENGELQVKGQRLDGEREGRWLFYREDGSLESKYFYVAGELNGPSVDYNTLGYPTVKTMYVMGDYQYYIHYDTSGMPMDTLYPHASEKVEYYNKHPQLGSEKWAYYLNGKLHGTLKGTFFNGKLSYISPYVMGDRHGKRITFFLTGDTSSVRHYEYGSLSGVTRRYERFGRLYSKGHFVADEYDGTFTRYHIDGSVFYERSYDMGNIHGDTKYYNPNGDLLMVAHWAYEHLDYVIVGTVGALNDTIYADNGKVEAKSTYANGNTAMQLAYENDVFVGHFNLFYEDGTPCYTSERRDGNFIGNRTWYAPDGTKQMEVSYKDGLRQGNEVHYYEDGTPRVTIPWKKGQQTGTVTYYNKDGSVDKAVRHVDGVPYGLVKN